MHDSHMERRPRAHHKHARHGGFSHDRMRGMDDEESHHYRFQHLEEVVGQLMSVAKDQNGCRCASATVAHLPGYLLWHEQCALGVFRDVGRLSMLH